MPLWLLVQALIQGATEFLPVSSTGHLGLSWALLENWGFSVPSPGNQQVIDIALHIGTLLAVILYFRGDIWRVAHGGLALFTPRYGRLDPGSLLFVRLVVASVPALLMGVLIADLRESYKNDLALIASTTLLFGLLLWIADRFCWSTGKLRHLSLLGAAFVGLLQCLAFIPGVSRSGITITAARFLGLDRSDAIKLSMLLSIPLILGAGLYGGLELWAKGELHLTQSAITAALIAFCAALASIHVLMELAQRATFLVFVLYRVALGLLIYAVLAFDWLPVAAA